MTEKKKCIGCQTELKLGKFAYNQELCWDCFNKEIQIILKRIDCYPSWFWGKRELHKSIIKHMQACMVMIFRGDGQKVTYHKEVKFNTKKEAEAVLSDMKEIIESYGFIALGGLYYLIALPSTEEDNKYGWINLSEAKINRIKDGYLLTLPRPILLGQETQLKGEK